MKSKLIILIAIISLFLSILSFAHPGRTDENGGHYDRQTGEYHYHHGYPAHQHPNGICPYNFDDKTNHNSNYYSGETYYYDYDEYSNGLEKGEEYGEEIGKENGYKDGLKNTETYKDLKSSYAYYQNNNTYLYASDEYQDGYRTGFESGYNAGYDKGLESGKKERKSKITKIILLSLSTLIVVACAIAKIISTRKKKRKAKIKYYHDKLENRLNDLSTRERILKNDYFFRLNEKEYRLRKTEFKGLYEGKSYNELLNLPKTVYYQHGQFYSVTQEDGYNPLTVYKNFDSKIFHSKFGCCGAVDYYDILNYSGCDKYKMCKKCGTQEQKELLANYPDWLKEYDRLKEIAEKYKINITD